MDEPLELEPSVNETGVPATRQVVLLLESVSSGMIFTAKGSAVHAISKRLGIPADTVRSALKSLESQGTITLIKDSRYDRFIWGVRLVTKRERAAHMRWIRRRREEER